MRGFKCILLCVLLHSVSVDAFYSCKNVTDDDACPDNSACVDVGLSRYFECKCDEGFHEIDLPGLTRDGRAATVCIDFGYCSQFDNKEDDCVNGQCVVYPDQYGSYQSTCKCKDGFYAYGEKCDEWKTLSKLCSAMEDGKIPKSLTHGKFLEN